MSFRLWADLPASERLPLEYAQHLATQPGAPWGSGIVQRVTHPEDYCPAAVMPFADRRIQLYAPCSVESKGKLCQSHRLRQARDLGRAQGVPLVYPLLPPGTWDADMRRVRERWRMDGFAEWADGYIIRVLQSVVAQLCPPSPGLSDNLESDVAYETWI